MGGPAASILGFATAAVNTAKTAAAVVADKAGDHLDTLKGGKIRVPVAIVNGEIVVDTTGTDVQFIEIDPTEFERV